MDKPKKRGKKFVRETDISKLPKKEISKTDIAILDIINRFHFIETSQIAKLINGNDRHVKGRLRVLFQNFRLVNRFYLDSTGLYATTPFVYYLDNKEALELLEQHDYQVSKDDYNRAKNYKEKNYGLYSSKKQPIPAGKRNFLDHEIMISRFRFYIEYACQHSNAKFSLAGFYRDNAFYSNVKTDFSYKYRKTDNSYIKLSESETLPIRPDAFFAINNHQNKETLYFYYEADRGTMPYGDMTKKFRAYFEYVIEQKKFLIDYNNKIKRIRAVLIETTTDKRANNLIEIIQSKLVSKNPSKLFLVTSSEHLTHKEEITEYNQKIKVPKYLLKPNLIFNKVWADYGLNLNSLVE